MTQKENWDIFLFHLICWFWRRLVPLSSFTGFNSTQDSFGKVWVSAVRGGKLCHEYLYPSMQLWVSNVARNRNVSVPDGALVTGNSCLASQTSGVWAGLPSVSVFWPCHTYSTGSSSSSVFRIQLLSFKREVFFLLSSIALVLAENTHQGEKKQKNHHHSGTSTYI